MTDVYSVKTAAMRDSHSSSAVEISEANHLNSYLEANLTAYMTVEEPFENLYTDSAPYDKQRLANLLTEFVQVDRDSGEPVRQSRFHDLNPEAQTTALMLYRHVAVELGEIDETELAVEAMWFDRNSDTEEHEVLDYESDLAFVDEQDDSMLYYIPPHRVDAAIEYLESQ